MKLSSYRAILSSGAACAALLASSQAFAQVTDEIIVTATKRASTIQDVPFSINAISQEDIQRTGATNLEDVSRNVAGLTIQNLGPGQSQVAIRGVSAGQIVRDQPGVKEQVGVYLDESVISLSLFTPDLDLFDLNRVETLRGPQGTLFGSGSVGGTLRFITNQPNLDETEAMLEANVNTVTDGSEGGHLKGMYNIPFADGKAALRAVGYWTEYAGFIDALGEGGSLDKDVNSGSRIGGRVALTFEPSDNVSITPRIVYQEIEADGFNRQEQFNLFANPYTTTRPAIQLEERQQYLLLDESFSDETLIADLTANIGLGAVDLTSVTTYTDRDILVSRDASALSGSVSIDLGFADDAVLLPSNLRDRTEVEQFTQELRLSSTAEGPLQWLIGGFYAKTDRVYTQRLPTPGYDAATDAALGAGTADAVANGFPADSPFNSDLPYELEQIAIFGEASFDLSEKLTLTAGGRYYDFNETRDIKTGGLFAAGGPLQTDETSSSGFTPRFLVSYDASEAVTLNAQVSQGFRLGGVNDPLNTALCSTEDAAIFGGFQSYDDETLWNYETGVKIRKNGLTFNAAAFYTDISNLQATLDAGSCSSRVVFNVPDAHTAGVEFEFNAPAGDDWEFGLSGSFIEAEFDSTVADGTGTVLAGLRDGNRLPSVPQFQLSANVTRFFDNPFTGNEGGYLTLSMQNVDNRFTQPSDQEAGAGTFVSGLPFGGATGAEVNTVDLSLDKYTIANVTTGLEFDSFDLQLYVTNIFDENANLSFDRERGGRARLGFRTNQPRTFGLTARYSY
ncbi:iron complex outermembrane receptor protein [Litorimonas taeanensis]|uniref:Iron complex outermembrane receptor protein n=1 Tax=Litorimonas taeanensis TaxID=568099 RepID=A0A420WDB8_9PROT|nr:TonB-dependent receptor [Litorimonas taeanensis]RKQ69034.1 iron complex outermembrane receptor protein [Litorimonas taeanensis]